MEDKIQKLIAGLTPENWEERREELFEAITGAGPDPTELERLLKAIAKEMDTTKKAVTKEWQEYQKRGETARTKNTASAIALKLVRESGPKFWSTPTRKAWMSITIEDHLEHHPVRGSEVQVWLSGLYTKHTGEALHNNILQEVLNTLASWSLYGIQGEQEEKPEEHPVFTRLAEHEGKVYLDLARPDWSQVEVDDDGWRVIPSSESPVRFRRGPYQKPLPIPERSAGALDEVLALLPLRSEADRALVKGWLIGTLHPRGPYPILVLLGEKGSGKSNLAYILKTLIDPAISPLRAAPKDEEALLVAAKNNLVVAYDNLSSISPRVSDALCRLSTGGGLAKRQLFTDDDEFVLDAKRPAIITGIALGVLRDDLADRVIPIYLRRLDKSECIPESELLEKFGQLHAYALGQLLDGVSRALKDWRSVRAGLRSLPRMADWCVWAEAAAPALGLKRGEIIQAFYRAQGVLEQEFLESDLVAQAILTLTADWPVGAIQEYTTSKLLKELEKAAELAEAKIKPEGWPRTPQGLGKRLPRIQAALRSEGVWIQGIRNSDTKNLQWVIRKEKKEKQENQPPAVGGDAVVQQPPLIETGDAADAVSEQQPPEEKPPPARLITQQSDLEALLPTLLQQPALGFDLETTGLDPHQDRVRLVSLAWAGEAALVDVFAVPLKALAPLFGAEGPTLIGHNLRFDLGFLLHAGIWRGAGNRLWDTALAEQVYTASRFMPSLADLSEQYLGQALDKSPQNSDWSGLLSAEQIDYAAKDALAVLRIQPLQAEKIRADGLDRVLTIEHRALPAIAWMEVTGVPFDFALWTKAALETAQAAEQALKDLPSGINWNSSAQVLRYLKDKGLHLEDTSESSLSRHREDPDVACLLRYRELAKRVNTYGGDWQKYIHPVTARIHPSWRQIGAETGRMACSGPNLQQVPSLDELREAFRPADGRVFIKADYSQIELRLAAVIAGETQMLEAYQQGKDLHRLTAARVLNKPLEAVTKEDRQLAKALNFGLLYGMGAASLRNYARTNYKLNLTEAEATKHREAFFSAYPGLRRWQCSQSKGSVAVRTLTGRRRVTDRYTEKLNTPVQGSGADGLKLALALLWERRERLGGAAPILAVHDEIVIEAPLDRAEEAERELARIMKEAMQDVVGARVPVEVEAGMYWDWGVTRYEDDADYI